MLHISTGVSKLGGKIPCVNLPAMVSCRIDAPCVKLCYARKGRFRFHNTMRCCLENYQEWVNRPGEFEREVQKEAKFYQFFRWHSSGDIPDFEYLRMMVRAAENTVNTEFLCFTKRFEWVNEYLYDHSGIFPENLHIVLSAWGDWIPENPFNLPMAYIRFKDSSATIPENARECPGFCGECVYTDNSCWGMKAGESVVFNQH